MAKSWGLVVFLVLEIVCSMWTTGVIKGVEGQQLSTGFYSLTCPSVEDIVQSKMLAHFQNDKTIAAHILRLQFHDCAATGCDASILLTGPQSEQEAPPNLTVLGYDIINDIKAQLEQNCTGVVSCADIITMAARDAVGLSGGPNFSVPLGRFDSTFSGGNNVNLPSPDLTAPATIAFFQSIGLSATDLVVLLGAHTIGVAHCSSFSGRLYNFQNTHQPDPSIDPAFLATLQATCPQFSANTSTTVPLDTQSQFPFDSHYYPEMEQHRGILGIDQEIALSSQTNTTVLQMTNQTLFFQNFAASMIKMGLIGVKDSTTGNVRSNCSVVGITPTADSPAPSPEPEFEVAPPPTAGG